MKNKNKILLVSLPLLLSLFGLILLAITESAIAGFLANTGYGLAKLAGIFFLTQHTDFFKTLYFKAIAALLGTVIVGALFQLMHWPGATIILSVSLLAIAVTYGLRFAYKDEKNRPDKLKLAWVLVAYLGTALFFMDWIPQSFLYAADVLLWVCIIDFLLTDYRSEQQIAPTVSIDMDNSTK